MKNLLFISFLFCLASAAMSQDKNLATVAQVTKGGNVISEKPVVNGTVLKAKIIDNDTIAIYTLPEFLIASERVFSSKKEEKDYGKLKRDVIKVYPYAKTAGILLRAYNDTLEMLGSEAKKKQYMKIVEEGLKEKFGKELTSLSVNQGRILIRLVDRETGDTSYELVKELRGIFSAFFWQSLARIFGNNLKSNYDPSSGEDKLIEEIITLIEMGVYKIE
jgi:hypothetical protein